MKNTARTLPEEQQKELRRCLGKFATGVTVVTCRGDSGDVYAMTVNSFSSVSLDPPLILWSIDKSTSALQTYLDAEYFAINILSTEQQDISQRCAESNYPHLEGLDIEESRHGLPILSDTLACLECNLQAVHDGGDHYIVIGRVEDLRHSDRQPLLFFDGSYRTLGR